jgi:hypothetical protein
MESMSPPAQQFLSGALPIVVTLVISIWLASISQKKRLDDIARRARRLERMEVRLDLHCLDLHKGTAWCGLKSGPLH